MPTKNITHKSTEVFTDDDDDVYYYDENDSSLPSDEVVEIIEGILTLPINYVYYEKMAFLVVTTPEKDILELYRREFEAIQNDLLNVNRDFQVPMQIAVSAYQFYCDYILRKKVGPLIKNIKRFEQSYKYWIHIFLKNFAKENKAQLYSEILKLDINKLKQIEPYWNGNLEAHIKYPGFNELIDCLKNIKYFQQLYRSYNKILDEKDVIQLEVNDDTSQTLGFERNVSTHYEKDDVIVKSDADEKNNYSELLVSLSKYISGMSIAEFEYLIEYNQLMPGKAKSSWLGNRADAHRFATIINISLPDFNKCFSMKNGKNLRHNDKSDSDSLITGILKPYFAE